MLRRIALLLVILALALAGCASDADRQEGGAGTEMVVPTNPVGSAEENTPAPGAPLPTLLGGTPGAEGTPQAVEAPFLASSMIGTEVAGQSGRYGAVEGIVFDPAAGQGQYLVVQNIGPEVKKDVLLPWGAFQLVMLAPDQAAQGGSYAPIIWLTVEDGVVAAAPEADAAALADPEQRGADWDAEARQYWTGKLPEMPVTGGEGQAALTVSRSLFDSIEYRVQDEAGEEIGQVENLVFEPGGALSFAVVELKSLLDLGEQQVIVPWRMLSWSAEERAFTLRASEDALRDAPRFDDTTLPDMSIPGWDKDWQEYWQGSGGRAPAQSRTSPASAAGQLQVSHLLGSAVTDVNEELLGEVVDIIFGADGAINYLVIQGGDKLRPVPWNGFEINAPDESILYLDDLQRFLDAPAFATLEQINAAAPGWDEQIRGYWGLGR